MSLMYSEMTDRMHSSSQSQGSRVHASQMHEKDKENQSMKIENYQDAL